MKVSSKKINIWLAGISNIFKQFTWKVKITDKIPK